MGDGSGTPAYLGGQPFIQLEGLTMDAAYIRLLRARTPLPDVLAHYHADYYATFRSPTAKAPCLPLAEPAQAGPHSPQLAGQVCSPPLAVLSDGDLEWTSSKPQTSCPAEPKLSDPNHGAKLLHRIRALLKRRLLVLG